MASSDNGSNAATHALGPAPGPINGQTGCAYFGGATPMSNTCTTCNSVCSTSNNTATGPFCGEGIIEGDDGETCDDSHADETAGSIDPTSSCTKCHACQTTTYLANGSTCASNAQCASQNCNAGTCM
jgi:hypothetical protein